MAAEAAFRFRRFTGVTATITAVDIDDDVFMRTLDIGARCQRHQTIFFFDADWWLLRSMSIVPFLDQKAIHGVVDPGVDQHTEFPYHDCKKFGIDPEKYLNTGFLVINHRHTEVFKRARQIMTNEKFMQGSHDFGEQSAVNYAIHQLRVPVRVLDHTFNYFPMFIALQGEGRQTILDSPQAVHAAGYGRVCNAETGEFIKFEPDWKLEALRYYSYKFGDAPKV